MNMNEDLFAKTLADHTARLEEIKEDMSTKEDISKLMDKLDKIVSLYTKKDEELTLIAHGQKDLTDRVEVLEKDMQQVKPALGLA